MLPPISVPVLEDGEGTVTPLRCKNVLEIRRRKMNRHKYKKLQKRTKFLRKRVLEGRGKKKQVGLFFHIYQTISFFSHYDILKFDNETVMIKNAIIVLFLPIHHCVSDVH